MLTLLNFTRNRIILLFCVPLSSAWLIMPSMWCVARIFLHRYFYASRARFTQWCEYLNWINGKLHTKKGVPVGEAHVSPGICIWLGSTTPLTPADGSSLNHFESLLRLLWLIVHTSVLRSFPAYYFVAFSALKGPFVLEHKWKDIPRAKGEFQIFLSLLSSYQYCLTERSYRGLGIDL